jgi:antitoxin component of RelBE/YafQ-DinJ toxin-antitoxin module
VCIHSEYYEKMTEETRLILRIDPELKKAAQAKAKAEDLTLSQAVRRLLREWIAEDRKPGEEPIEQD